MIRRVLVTLVVSAGAAGIANAQVTPPKVAAPIEAAKKAAGAANQQLQEQVGTPQQAPTKAPATAAPATPQKATPQKAIPATPQKATPATPQKATPAAPQKAGAADPKAPQKAGAANQKASPAESQKATGAATPPQRARSDSTRIVFAREVFSYPRDGRRDPFGSLIQTGDVRPLFNDLVVTGIMFDPTGRTSVAMLQDVSTLELYRARVGSVFGRIRITAIRVKEVGLAIDEFGYTRQEVLSLNAPSPVGRTP